MALDPNVTPTAPQSAPTRGSAIENEIPTYRAISPQAVLALVFGVLALFSVTHLIFLVFALAAVVTGALADRKIQRLSDVLTGRRLARAGIALGLVFGLGAPTTWLVQIQIRQAEATKFAKRFTEILKNGSAEEAFWYKQPPALRKGKTPQEIIAEITKGSRDPRMLDRDLAPFRAIKSRLTAAKGEEIHFEKVERHDSEGFDSHAAALLELHGPGSKDFPETEQHALVVMKGSCRNGKMEWWVEGLRFPYTPSTYTAPVKPVDDGHGHAH
jgi:hypothetical protein